MHASLRLAFSAIPLLAHHGWAGNQDQEFEISGTVTTGVSLAGPHATMKIKDDKGQVWDLTLAPPARTDSSGLKEGTIPVGAKELFTATAAAIPKSLRSRPSA